MSLGVYMNLKSLIYLATHLELYVYFMKMFFRAMSIEDMAYEVCWKSIGLTGYITISKKLTKHITAAFASKQ